MSVKCWMQRLESLVVPLIGSAETLWSEIGVSEEQREKVLQRSVCDQRNFFESIVAEAKLLRDRLSQENSLLENELRSLGSELKIVIPAKPIRATLSEAHEWLSREVAHVQAERARRNRQFLVEYAEYTFLRGLLDERGDSNLLEAYRDCVSSRVRVANEADTRKLGELLLELRAERTARANEFEALRVEVNQLVSLLDYDSASQHSAEQDDVEALLDDEFLKDLLNFDVHSVRVPDFGDFVDKRLADANANRMMDEPFFDGNATMSFLCREQSIAIGDDLQALPHLAVANLLTLRDARDRLSQAVNTNRECCSQLKRAIETIWDRLDVSLEPRCDLIATIGGDAAWQSITLSRDSNTKGIASKRVRSILERALSDLESAKRAQIPRIVERIRSDLMTRWAAVHLDVASELSHLDAYVTACVCLPADVTVPGMPEADRIAAWCSAGRADTVLEAHEQAEAGWSDWLSVTDKVHERIARWVECFKRLVYGETDARRDPDYATNRGGFILKLQKEVASLRKELATLERTITTLIAEYDTIRHSALNQQPAQSICRTSFGQELLLSREILVQGKQFGEFSAEQFELLEMAKREFAASTKKGGQHTLGNSNINATGISVKGTLLRLDTISEEQVASSSIPPTTPKKRGGVTVTSNTPSKRGRLGMSAAVSTASLASFSQNSTANGFLHRFGNSVNPNSTASSQSTTSSAASRSNLVGHSKVGSITNLTRAGVKNNPAVNRSRLPISNNSRLLSGSQLLSAGRSNASPVVTSSRAGHFSSRLPLPVSRMHGNRNLPSNANGQAAFVLPRSPSPDGGQRTIRVQEQRARALNSKRRSRSFTDLRALQAEPMMIDEMAVVQESSMDSLGATPLGADLMHSVGVGTGAATPTGLTRYGMTQPAHADGASQRVRGAPSTSTIASMSSGLGSSACTTSANVTALGFGGSHYVGRSNAGVQTSIGSGMTSAFGDSMASTSGASEDCSFVGSHGANSTKIEEGFATSETTGIADAMISTSKGFANGQSNSSFLI